MKHLPQKIVLPTGSQPFAICGVMLRGLESTQTESQQGVVLPAGIWLLQPGPCQVWSIEEMLGDAVG